MTPLLDRGAAACRLNGPSQDARELTGFLQERHVLLDAAVFQVLQPVHALVGFFKRDLQLRAERRPRSTFSGCTIVGSH